MHQEVVIPESMKPKDDKKPTLETLSDEEIKDMSAQKLSDLCKDEDLVQKGTKNDKIKRLFLKKYGISDRYVNLMTKCRVCHHAVRVIGTDTKKLPDGRTFVTRNVKCIGRHRHTYPIKE